MAKKKSVEEVAPVEETKQKFVMSPLDEAKLKQFKRMFPRECALLIEEFKATNG